MAAKQCHNCGKPLEGRQRKWCSEACRKQAARRKKRVRVQAKTSGLRPLSRTGRKMQMRLIVDSEGMYPYLYQSSKGLILAVNKVMMSKRVQRMLVEELEHKIPGYDFTVVILPGP